MSDLIIIGVIIIGTVLGFKTGEHDEKHNNGKLSFRTIIIFILFLIFALLAFSKTTNT